MDVPFLLSDSKMSRIDPFFPLAHGVSRVDDKKIISGIIFVIAQGLTWRDAPKGYGPHKTIYNRFVRWSKLGVFDRIFAELAQQIDKSDEFFVDLPRIRAHRTASKLLQEGCFPSMTDAPDGARGLMAAGIYNGDLTGNLGPLFNQSFINYFNDENTLISKSGNNILVICKD